MGKKKQQSSGSSVNMDSFLDILTCLVGVLVLIIILTSLDAAQVKVLINTPMAQKTDKRMLLIECRNEMIYPIDLDSLQAQIEEEFSVLDRTLSGDPAEMREALRNLIIESDYYTIDPSYALVGQIALTPKRDVPGDDLKNINMQMLENMIVPGWFGDLLRTANKDFDVITFLVRDDGFQIFRRARAIAWMREIEVAYELLPLNAPMIFGLGGELPLLQ